MRTIRLLAMTLALQIVITLSAIYLFNNPAIADTTAPKIVAYDIDEGIDQQRKQETQKRYGEEVGEIVDDALQNNQESPEYKIKREDSLNKKVDKFFQQIKEKGLIDVEGENNSPK